MGIKSNHRFSDEPRAPLPFSFGMFIQRPSERFRPLCSVCASAVSAVRKFVTRFHGRHGRGTRYTFIETVLAVFAVLLLSACGPDPAIPDPGYESFAITDFSLVDQDNKPIDASILDGRYTVLDFFFTNCPIYCPAMSQAMLRVQRETQSTGLRLLSISVDGERDTPEILAAYARQLGADPDRWCFATGDPEHVRDISEGQLKLGITYDPTRPISLGDGSTMSFIDHPTRLILIGPDRQVLGMYSYTREDEIDLLIKRIHRLPRPPTPPEPPAPPEP